VILHIPHSSRMIPPGLREHFVLTEEELELELLRMTDAYTDEIYRWEDASTVRFPVSRLVVDVERFEEDEWERMSKVGMGKVPIKTSHGEPMKRPLAKNEIGELVEIFYRPHHQALEAAVRQELKRKGHALIVDCHSFPSEPLPCDLDQNVPRPDFCLGSDPFHTQKALIDWLEMELRKNDRTIKINAPYSGTIVPRAFLGKDKRVSSIMIEINRSLYMDESTGEKHRVFDRIKEEIHVLLKGLKALR
jgi:N-formylglutamate deformylase